MKELLYWVARLFFTLSPWRFQSQGSIPLKVVAIGAPHTSNWDFLFMLMIAWLNKRQPHWIGKHTLFKPPFGFVMKMLGGIPVDRSARQNTVQQILKAMEKEKEFFLVVTPEGTRKPVSFWKSGFYHIAREGGLPIILGYADYKTKVCGLGPVLHPNGNMAGDFKSIQSFYTPIAAKYPEKFIPEGIRPRPSKP
jgi:1-acyl-sn-glycerol-3-phosphate acyltransferase